NAAAGCGPVNVDTTIHTARPEGDRTAMIITSIIEYRCRYQRDAIRPIGGEGHDGMRVTVNHRRDIVYYRNREGAGAAIATQIRDRPGGCMRAQFKIFYYVAIAHLYDRTGRHCERVRRNRRAGIIGQRTRYRQ